MRQLSRIVPTIVSRFARHTMLFSGLTMVSRASGLIRTMAFTAVLGLLRINDAFQLANTLPYMVYEFVMGGLLSAIFIPLLVREQEKHGKNSAEARRVANLLTGYVGLVLAVVSVLAIILSPQIIYLNTLLNKGVTAGSDRELATYFFRFFAPQVFFYGLSAVFTAILNSHEVFGITAAAPILTNIAMIVSVLAYGKGWIGAEGLAIGTTAGIAAMALVQVPWLFKVGMPVRPKFDFRDPTFAAVLTIGFPIIIQSAVNIFGTAVRTNLLYTVEGGYATYAFCFQLVMMAYGIFAVSLATVLYPAMSRAAVDADKARFRETFSLGMRWTVLIMLPIALGMSLLAEPINRVLFERGKFNYSDTVFASRFLRFYALSVLPFATVSFATRAFYAMKDTVTPTWVNAMGVVVAVILNFVFMRWMGVPGIGVVPGIVYTLTTIGSLLWLRRVLGAIDGRRLFGSVARMAIGGAVMSLTVWGLARYTEPTVVTIDRGSRTPFRLPPAAIQGNALLLKSQTEFAEAWKLLGQQPNRMPHVDFAANRVVAVFGPASATTSSLSLQRVGVYNNTLTMDVDVYAPTSNTQATLEAITSPAYVLAIVRAPVDKVEPRFVRMNRAAPSRIVAILQAPDAVRLALLIVTGAAVYFAAILVLGGEEPRSMLAYIARRRGSQST